MAFKKYEELFEAIKVDDEARFASLMLSNSDLNLCFGRFPLLSVCYLFKSFKILSKYEHLMLQISNFEIVPENYEIYKEFSKHAGKSLRLYMDCEFVYPIEILAILDEREILTKNYKFLFKNDKILQNLNQIYNFNSKNEIVISSNSIEILPKISTRKRILTSILAIFIVICMVFPIVSIICASHGSGLGTERSPIKLSSALELSTALERGKGYYILTDDILLSGDTNYTNFSGTIDGDGHTIIVSNSGEGLINSLSGSLYNLNFLFEDENIKISNNLALLTKNLTGIVKNCTFSGNFNLNFDAENATYFSIIAYNLAGTIDSCTAELNITAVNNSNHDSYVCGFASVVESGGRVVDCKLNGAIAADTVDIAGAVCENRGTINGFVSSARLTQSTDSAEWSPNVSGVAIQNYGEITSCKNMGEVSVTSTAVTTSSIGLFAAGIVCTNYFTIDACENSGDIIASAMSAADYVGGICAYNIYYIEKDELGNILSGTLGNINNSSSACKVQAVSSTYASVGGVCGYSVGYSSYNITAISGCNFVGNISVSSADEHEETGTNFLYYSGGIVGVASNAYIANSYASAAYFDCKNTQDISCLTGLIGYFSGCSLSNLSYVKDGSFDYCAYGYFTIFLSVHNGPITSELEPGLGITSYETLEQLLSAQNSSGGMVDA